MGVIRSVTVAQELLEPIKARAEYKRLVSSMSRIPVAQMLLFKEAHELVCKTLVEDALKEERERKQNEVLDKSMKEMKTVQEKKEKEHALNQVWE